MHNVGLYNILHGHVASKLLVLRSKIEEILQRSAVLGPTDIQVVH